MCREHISADRNTRCPDAINSRQLITEARWSPSRIRFSATHLACIGPARSHLHGMVTMINRLVARSGIGRCRGMALLTFRCRTDRRVELCE